MAESKAISIRVPDLLLEKIDRLAEEKYKSHKGTPNRSLVILDAIVNYFDTLSDSKFSDGVHTITDDVMPIVMMRLETLEDKVELLSDNSDVDVDDISISSDSVSIAEFNELRDLTIALSDSVKQIEDRLFTLSDNVIRSSDSVKQPVDEEPEQGQLDVFTVSDNVILNGKQLAERLGVTSSTITNHKNSSELLEWSKQKDPESIGWSYNPVTNKFSPVESLA